MTESLFDFEELIGSQGKYVQCKGKTRVSKTLFNVSEAAKLVEEGYQIGWWVSEGHSVIDIDEAPELCEKAIHKFGIKTFCTKTPRGCHIYCLGDQKQVVGYVNALGLKCDTRGAMKGYVVLPFGSNDRSVLLEAKIATIPELLKPIYKGNSLLGIGEGEGRNEGLFKHLSKLRKAELSRESVAEAAEWLNANVFSKPLPDSELKYIINQIDKYADIDESNRNPVLLYNEKGFPFGINYDKLCSVIRASHDIIVVGGDVYEFLDGVYVKNSSGIRRVISETIGDPKFITQNKVMDCYKYVADQADIVVNPKSLNPMAHRVFFKDCVYDCKEGVMLPHSPDNLNTYQLPWKLQELDRKKSEPFKEFLNDLDLAPEDLKVLLQYVSWCLIAENHLKCFLCLYGQSNTGKSLFLNSVINMIGKHNTSGLSIHDLSKRFYPTQLFGKLLNICGDCSTFPLQDIETLKKVTGGDQIMYESKGKDATFFTPFARFIFAFNQMPTQEEEYSDAFYRRLRIIKFYNVLEYSQARVNEVINAAPHMIPELLELHPIERIEVTSNILRESQKLRSDSDSVIAFLEECTVRRAGAITEKHDLYDMYFKFCVDTGRKPEVRLRFHRRVEAQGLKLSRCQALGGNRWDYKDIEIKVTAKCFTY